MTGRGTVGLAIVFAALAGYLLLVEPPSSRIAHPARLVPALAEATRVEVDGDEGPLAAERRGDAWSPAVAGDLVATLETIEILTVIDPASATPETFGLRDALRLRVLSGARVLVALEVGANNPAGTGVYVRRHGEDPVLLVGALLRWEIDKLHRALSAASPP